MYIPESELIINPDGSIYHLNLLPEDLSPLIITVGDQERVSKVSSYFDEIEVKKSKREFACHTGIYKGKRISVISTGIGTDNIDIVFNEVDALFNIDFNTRQETANKTQLTFIRLGTSGSVQADVPIDQFLISETAIGIDNLNMFYSVSEVTSLQDKEAKIKAHLDLPLNIYTVKADTDLVQHFAKHGDFILGNTLTSIGFYGPQGRRLRNQVRNEGFLDHLSKFKDGDYRITNLEMETSGIYLMADNLGHRAISINALLANRQLGTFSNQAGETVDRMIQNALDIIALL